MENYQEYDSDKNKLRCIKCHFLFCFPCRLFFWCTPCKDVFDDCIDEFAENNYKFCYCKKKILI